GSPTMYIAHPYTTLFRSPERKAAISSRTPMGRVGKVEELVGAAIFLASQASSFVTGETIDDACDARKIAAPTSSSTFPTRHRRRSAEHKSELQSLDPLVC